MKPVKAKILIVEDDEFLIDILRDICENKGCEVRLARNGHEAITVLEKEKVTLVISDVRMPGMDGFTLLKEVQKRGWEVPIILMSGHSDCTADDVDQFNGVVLLEKPFTKNQVEEIVQHFVGLLV